MNNSTFDSVEMDKQNQDRIWTETVSCLIILSNYLVRQSLSETMTKDRPQLGTTSSYESKAYKVSRSLVYRYNELRLLI